MVGEYLRARRAESGRKAVDIIAVMKISRPLLYAWETGRVQIDPVDVRRLLELYGCAEDVIAEALRLRSIRPPDVVEDPASPTA